jgi:hypothetical protein
MSGAVALASGEAKTPAVRSRAEFRRVLDRALAELGEDERAMKLLRAASMRVRFEFPDLELVLNVAAGDGPGGGGLRWEFSDRVDWSPRLELVMDSEVANSYLQGSESLAIAIAHRRVRCRGDARVTLLYVPAFRLVCEPYRRVIEAEFSHLVLD